MPGPQHFFTKLTPNASTIIQHQLL
jgi:hypothetical protein